MDDRDRMERRAPWVPWAFTSLALVAVAALAYSFGVHREAGDLAAEPVRWRHGGFGGIWAFFLLFWIFGGLRRIVVGWLRVRPVALRPPLSPVYDDRDDWDEWHRREHERMDRSNATSSSSNQGRSHRIEGPPRSLPSCPLSSS